jgi:O-antigen/teichoic acid export membrane protein
VGFGALGFNDGVHLNYATCSYDKKLASKFRSFSVLLFIMTLAETVVSVAVLTALFGTGHEKYTVFVFSVLNIIPVILNGLFTYMNQATMRFKEYAFGNMVDKFIFTVAMVVLILLGCKNYIFYIGAYTASRYLVSVYHFITSRDVFTQKPQPFGELKPEIVKNFKDGFSLMIAVLLNGSIIVGSRVIVENFFGIEEFGAFSFSIHTLVVASQFISAIASVFYPILKRCPENELSNAYGAFDNLSSILSAVLLLSYYPAVVLINVMYVEYSTIISYFMFVYPLFIFQCKSNLLVINTLKVQRKQGVLIIATALAVVLNVVGAWIAYVCFGTVAAIAASTIITYALWYYVCQLFIYRMGEWKLRADTFTDLLFTVAFIAANFVSVKLVSGSFYAGLALGALIYVVFCFGVFLIGKKNIKKNIRNAMKFLKD